MYQETLSQSSSKLRTCMRWAAQPATSEPRKFGLQTDLDTQDVLIQAGLLHFPMYLKRQEPNLATMADNNKFTLAMQIQNKKDNDPEVTNKVCEEIKQSVIFQYNWNDLLQSAPMAISATGSCYSAYSSAAGQQVKLVMPATPKYIECDLTALILLIAMSVDLV